MEFINSQWTTKNLLGVVRWRLVRPYELTIPYQTWVLTHLLTHRLTVRHNILLNTTFQKTVTQVLKADIANLLNILKWCQDSFFLKMTEKGYTLEVSKVNVITKGRAVWKIQKNSVNKILSCSKKSQRLYSALAQNLTYFLQQKKKKRSIIFP